MQVQVRELLNTTDDDMPCEYCEEPIEEGQEGVAVQFSEYGRFVGLMILHPACYTEVKKGYEPER